MIVWYNIVLGRKCNLYGSIFMIIVNGKSVVCTYLARKRKPNALIRMNRIIIIRPDRPRQKKNGKPHGNKTTVQTISTTRPPTTRRPQPPRAAARPTRCFETSHNHNHNNIVYRKVWVHIARGRFCRREQIAAWGDRAVFTRTVVHSCTMSCCPREKVVCQRTYYYFNYCFFFRNKSSHTSDQSLNFCSAKYYYSK